MSLLKKVRGTIKRYNLLTVSDNVVVGVSGGPDSVALLLLLSSLKREFKLNLHIAHLDHCLRKGSCRDQEFVRLLARRLKIPFISEKIDIRRLCGRGAVEETAREQRLKFLFGAAKHAGADKIALGHNRDDQAETVLMRLIRGAGLSGLGSILPKRNFGRWIIIRPLIETPREVIDSYLKRRRIKPREDSSNKDNIYFRNHIRNCLIPELIKDYNPNIKEVLANTAQVAACDYDYLKKAALQAFNRLKKQLKGNLNASARLDLSKLSGLHPAIQRLVLRFCIAEVKGSTRRLTFKHIKEIEDLLLYRPVNSIVDLPEGVSVLKNKKYLCVYQKQS